VAVNAYKQIWSYSAENAGTWSEVFYVQAATLDSALSISPAFINKRLKMLGKTNFLEKIRVSEITNLRNSQPKRINLPGLWETGNPYPDSVACVMTLVSKEIKATRQWWMRGINDDFANRDPITGRNKITGDGLQAMNTFLQALQDGTYLILPKVNQAAIGNPPNPVTTVDGLTTPGFSILTTKNAAALVAGQIIICQRFSKKDLPGLNGKYKVLAAAGNSVTIQYRTPLNKAIEGVTGQIQLYVPNVGAIINRSVSFFNFLGDHQTKNELTGSRGAKSAVRVRNSP
jgi:hypothetical protein